MLLKKLKNNTNSDFLSQATENGMSEVVKGLQGAEFTWKLKSEVDHVGWDNATTYDVINNWRRWMGYN